MAHISKFYKQLSLGKLRYVPSCLSVFRGSLIARRCEGECDSLPCVAKCLETYSILGYTVQHFLLSFTEACIFISV